MKSLSIKKDNTEKQTEKVSYLFGPEVAEKFRNSFTKKVVDRAYKLKEGFLLNGRKGGPESGLLDSFTLDNPYIFSRVLDVIETDDIRLDLMMGVDRMGRWGIPRGKVIEISGPEECMKSARALQWIKAAQNDSRGCICVYMDTESKVHPKYAEKDGVDISQVVVEFPAFVEAAYWSIEDLLQNYIKERDMAVVKYIKDNYKTKDLTRTDLDRAMYMGRLSYPLLLFVYDSVGNHQSMIAWQKNQKTGEKTQTPGTHAHAHADGMRAIKNLLGYAMATLVLINHTKDDMGGQSKWGAKKTKTYGGVGILHNSDFRIEQRAGVGDTQTSQYKYTKKGKEIIAGKWLNVKCLKNSISTSSKMTIEHTLFKYSNGFDTGVSYLQALDSVGMVKGGAKLKSSAKNIILLPDEDKLEVNLKEFNDMLIEKKGFKNKLRKIIIDRINNSTNFVKDNA